MLSNAAVFGLTVIGVLAAYFGIAAFVTLTMQAKRECDGREAIRGESCPRCGKPVLSGAELYHAQRCYGKPKSMRVFRFGRGERIDR